MGNQRASSIKPAVKWAGLLLAFAVATGGATATATSLITGRDVKNGSLTGRDIARGSLTGVDVQNRSLGPRDFKGSLRGPAGPPGPGVSGLELVQGPITAIAGNGGTAFPEAYCPAGKRVLSGGYSIVGADQGGSVTVFAPLVDGPVANAAGRMGWAVGVVNLDYVGAFGDTDGDGFPGPQPGTVRAIAWCAAAGTSSAGTARAGAEPNARSLGRLHRAWREAVRALPPRP